MSADEKIIEEAAKGIKHYLDPILLQPLSELGLLARDKVAFWRFKNQVNMVLKTKEFLEAKGLHPKTLDQRLLPEIIVPLLESAENHSDPTMTEMFAHLLVSAIDPQSEKSFHPSFTKVLDQLSPVDARILSTIYTALIAFNDKIQRGGPAPDSFQKNRPTHRQFGMTEQSAQSTFQIDEQQTRLSFANLKRLGVCDEGFDVLNRVNQVGFICLTDFGLALVMACKGAR